MNPRVAAARRAAIALVLLGAGAAARATSAADAGAPTLDELRSATVSALGEPSGTAAPADPGAPVTLRDGRWEGEPVTEGGASRPSVWLVRGFRATGDLDGDGAEEAVVLVGSSSGGSGSFVHAVVFGRREGAPVQLAAAALGDRTQVRAARIADRLLRVYVVQAGAGDAACCPGEVTIRAFRFEPAGADDAGPARLSAVDACKTPRRLGPEILGDAEWVLRRWSWGEPAAGTPEVTLQHQLGRLGGSSGCNRYSASVTPGAGPGDVTLGPAAATRRACPEPAASTEQRFLGALGAVQRLGFLAGQLALTSVADGRPSTLLFDERPGRPSGPGASLDTLFCAEASAGLETPAR